MGRFAARNIGDITDNETKMEEMEAKAIKKAIESLNIKDKDVMKFRRIVDEFTDHIVLLKKEPLDSDMVNAITDLVRAQLNRKEGNW